SRATQRCVASDTVRFHNRERPLCRSTIVSGGSVWDACRSRVTVAYRAGAHADLGIDCTQDVIEANRGNERRSRTSTTARWASRIAASVCELAAASELAMEMRPKGWRALTLGRSFEELNTHSSGSYRLLYEYA